MKNALRSLTTSLLLSCLSPALGQVDCTDRITNPSFETGDMTGWTIYVEGNPVEPGGELNAWPVTERPLNNADGNYVMNWYAWTWTWNEQMDAITQSVQGLPAGRYALSALLGSWKDWEVTLSVNGSSLSKTMTADNDYTGEEFNVQFELDGTQDMNITVSVVHVGSNVWGASFFKADNFRLSYYGGPLPNDNTALVAGQWYYYDVPSAGKYFLFGQTENIVFTTDPTEMKTASTTPSHIMELQAGRIYFKPTTDNTTLRIMPERELQQTRFTACALNVDGLPNTVAGINLNADGPGSEGTKLISQYIAAKGYDFIGASEDFNYNGSLMSAIEGNYSCGTIRTTLSISGIFSGFPFDTDGLNLIWKNSTTTATNESWTRWTSTTNTDGNQYVKKGFRHYDMSLSDGTMIDIFILHMDAGDAISSRESQWLQLANAIYSSYNNNRPKIILGDTNSRWTREDIQTKFFDILTNGYDLTDAWVEHWRSGVYPTTDMDDLTDQSNPSDLSRYEVVDKIIYLNPKAEDTPKLKALSFRLEQDYTYDAVNHDGNTQQLGDHRPAVAEFMCVKTGDITLVIGDVNKDGQITIADVTALVNIILGKDNTQPYQYDHLAADVNMDGSITIADVTALVNIILGKN